MADDKPSENPIEVIEQLAKAGGGTVKSITLIPTTDGGTHSSATVSFPLPKDHWLYEDNDDANAPPMPFKCGFDDKAELVVIHPDTPPVRDYMAAMHMTREEFAEHIRAAARYAVRASTMHGKNPDFDPDAMVLNVVVGMLGYWTSNGLTGPEDDWMNPPRFRKVLHK